MTEVASGTISANESSRNRWVSLIVFVAVGFAAGATVAGPGLTWDEPAYRHSQVTLQNWFRNLYEAESYEARRQAFTADAIDRFWEYNRFGHNFHPPMGGYLNLASWVVMRHWWDDVSARRLASALLFAASAAVLCHFIGSHYGWKTGLFAAGCLATMPRLMGHAHVIGTDMPLMFFWAATAVAFYRGMTSRAWQWATALLWACLFLVKFSGAVIAAPLAIWLSASLIRNAGWEQWKRWLGWSVALFLPLTPLAVVLLWGWQARNANPQSLTATLAKFGMEYSHAVGALFLWPIVCLMLYHWRRRKSEPADWLVGWETPWVVAAVTPLACILFNPSWWHDPVTTLARYFDLNLHRQEHLPNIGIFYLGQRYLYSLPPFNAYVLMAVTIPAGVLLLGLAGIVRCLARYRDPLGWYLILQMITLPVFRMFPTPAHDGVRLFLPTFVFWAALAALGARAVVNRVAESREKSSAAAWLALAAIGPGWAFGQWVGIHPYELSYYNVGLKRAMDWGFEVTYWYDAVTPAVLDDLNETLPRNVSIGFPDELINPETFFQLQELGRLRADIRLGDAPEQDGDGPENWIWLLTHSSKATAFTRLLYACRPWYESGYDGVRMFSVVDDRSTALAFALYALTVDRDLSSSLGPLHLNTIAFQANAEELQEAARLVIQFRGEAIGRLDSQTPSVVALVKRWVGPDGRLNPNVAAVLEMDPSALSGAARIVGERGADVRKVLTHAGYLRPEQFGGYFERSGDAR